MKVRLLLDENMSPRVRMAVQRHEPRIDILRVGDQGAPALKTADPEILLYLEEQQRLLITMNRASMPGHVGDRFRAGHHHWGVLYVKPEASISAIVAEILLLWEASEAEEWVDRFDWIPF